MSFYRYGKLRSREDITQLDRGRVTQTRLLLSGAVSSAQEETPVENLLTVVSRETSPEPTAGQQHWGGRQMTGDPSSASSLEDSPEAQLTCPSSAKALLPYHCHKQGLLPPPSPLIFIFFSMAAQLQMQALRSYTLCPQHPQPRAQRGLCAHRWRRADGGCADWGGRDESTEEVGPWAHRAVANEKGSGPGSSGARTRRTPSKAGHSHSRLRIGVAPCVHTHLAGQPELCPKSSTQGGPAPGSRARVAGFC